MRYPLPCPRCHKPLSVREEDLKHPARCPHCHAMVVLPAVRPVQVLDETPPAEAFIRRNLIGEALSEQETYERITRTVLAGQALDTK